jgi:hypothetical protein
MSRPQTLADRRGYLEGGLTEVCCDECGAQVRAKKMSPAQTSVQWTTPAARRCLEFAARPEPSALVPTCGLLRASIERAVREGRLGVPT